MSGGRRVVLVVGCALVLAACGGISRSEFDEEIQSRGGGLGSDLPLAAVDALEEELGDDDLRLSSMTISAAAVTMDVLVPGTEDQVDSYRYGTSGLYGGGGLSDPTPVSGVDREGLARSLFQPDRLALEDLDDIVDDALERADVEGGYAQGVQIGRSGRQATITVQVTSARESVQVRYRGNGAPLDEELG